MLTVQFQVELMEFSKNEQPVYTSSNFIGTSGAAATHSIWQKNIGGQKEEEKPRHELNAEQLSLLKQAKASESDAPKSTHTACKKCGQLGHLTYQCLNDRTDARLTEPVPDIDKETKAKLAEQDRVIEKLRKAIEKKRDRKKDKKKQRKEKH